MLQVFKQQIYLKEFHMFEVSDKASEVIRTFLEGKEGPHSIRITLNEGG